jgi:hypothetical protein
MLRQLTILLATHGPLAAKVELSRERWTASDRGNCLGVTRAWAGWQSQASL